MVFALAFVGAYALVRQLGAGRIGAAVAGAAFAYAPWRLAQAGHLQVLSTGGIALALAMLARGHGWSLRHGYRPERHAARLGVSGLVRRRLAGVAGVRHRLAVRVRACSGLRRSVRRLAVASTTAASRLLFSDGAGMAVFLAVAV